MTDIEWFVTAALAVINLSTVSVLGGSWLQIQCWNAARTWIARRSKASHITVLETAPKDVIATTSNPLLLPARRIVMQQSDDCGNVPAEIPTALMSSTRHKDRRSAAAFSPLKRTV
jgi:hypothetical protein